MITEIQADRLLVVSDLHLGNPFSTAQRKLVEFLHWAARNDYDVCINGDGLEIAQVSFSKLAREVPEVLHTLKLLAAKGRKTYYVVGNHDIALENFLEDFGVFSVSPFLNVVSGDSRIRIEHGHLYDPFFVKSPRLYEFSTWFAGLFLKIHPSLYRLWISYERLKSRIRARRSGTAIVGEHPSFAVAARELSQRGFDYVVFGHTHHVGQVDLGEGRLYLNPGSWMLGASYVEVSGGKAALKHWNA